MADLKLANHTTGRDIRRYEHEAPGGLIHVDIKKLGWIPYGGGHRAMDRAAGKRNKTKTAANRHPGYAHLQNAVDDLSHHHQFNVPALRLAA